MEHAVVMSRMVLRRRVRFADSVAKGDSGPSSSANSRTYRGRREEEGGRKRERQSDRETKIRTGQWCTVRYAVQRSAVYCRSTKNREQCK
jgi:hypothetical protein